jgi:hypothetical protein
MKADVKKYFNPERQHLNIQICDRQQTSLYCDKA